MPPNAKKKDTPPNSRSTLIQIESLDQEYSLFPYLDLSPNPELSSQGWDRRFMVGPDRVKEANQLYRELGYEVLNEPVRPSEFNEICKECQTIACNDYVIIYTRKAISSNASDHENPA